jgi:flagellar hook-associated protein 2
MAPIASFGGLASGIQWQDMIDQIMKLETTRSVAPLATRTNTQAARIDAWKTYEGLVNKLKSASVALKDGSSFSIFNTTAGTTAAGGTVVSASASSSAAAGSYQVEVIALARAAKLSGRDEASTSTALGFTGQFHVNGRAVDVEATDTLSQLRDKINAVNSGTGASGVTATILTTGTDAHRLILTADQTGSRGIELVDSASGGGVLQQLGILDGTLTANTSLTDPTRTESQRFTSSAGNLATMLGVSPAPALTSIKIGGQKIDVDLANDTMIDIMNRVTAAGGSASLVEEPVGGSTLYRLSVAGLVEVDTDVGVDPAVSQRVIELLGLQQGGRPEEIVAGSDAVAEIDGFALTRRGNVISDAIDGVTVNLLAAEPGGVVDLTISRNSGGTVAAIQAYADAFNAIKDFIGQQQSSDGVLATNGTLRASVRSLTEVMLKDVESLVGTGFSRAANAGVSLDRDGKLTLDVAALTSALENSPNDVKALFGAVGDSMYQASNSIAAAFSGTVASQIRFLTESNEALELRIDDVEQRLELRRESLIRQYTRMETMLTQIQSQGSWLTQQIQSLEPSNT